MVSPRKFIIWPASLAFIVSYPLLYALLSPSLPHIPITPNIPTVDPEVKVKQLYISPPPFQNAVSTDLLGSLSPFFKHFDDINVDEHESDHLINSSHLPYLHSVIPRSYNSYRLNEELGSLDSLFNHSNNSYQSQLDSVLYSPRIVDNKIFSASGLLLSYIYTKPEDEERWKNAILSLIPEQLSQKTVSTYSYNVSPKTTTKTPSLFSPSSYKFIPHCPKILSFIIIVYTLIVLLFTISWENIKLVRSKMGLFVAFVVQTCLAMSASLTLVSLVFPEFSVEILRNFLIIPFLIISNGIENVLQLIDSVAVTPPENHPSVRLSVGIKSIHKTVCTVGYTCCALLVPCLPFVPVAVEAKHICLYIALCLIIDLLMHSTYFVAILSVDLRRLELQDLISTRNSPNLEFDSFNDPIPKSVNIYYHYLKSNLLHPKITASIFTLVISFVFLFVWSVFTDPAEKHNYSAGSLTFFLTPLFSSLSLEKYGTIKVFEPLVLEGRNTYSSQSFPIVFHIGHCIQGSIYKFMRMISVTIILEFIASLAFILSLSGLILKILLPPVPDHTELNETQKETLQFSSKELTGFQNLDVLKIVCQQTTIGTVSLDHTVNVWSLAYSGSHDAQPAQNIKIPQQFWPIDNIAINPLNCTVAVFSSKRSTVLLYNYKLGMLLFHLKDNIFNTTPVDAFFSGVDLIIITKTKLLLSINETGAINTTKIDFVTNAESIIHAKRLVTPRIPERVVCLSSGNDVSIGTHIGKTWRFRKLQIQESPTQIYMHTQGVHDFSKYKPKPFPAPQAMMARRSMRPEKVSMVNACPIEKPSILQKKIVAFIPVPAINMVLIASSVHACLFDAQTGIIVKHFQLGHFSPKTLRVFHSHPSHCRFCGCASVDTLSIAYTDSETEGMVICHTLTIDNRAKNSICIRVERDPRETRCLGFEATTERQHWINNVEGWDSTDMNMILGVRRRENEEQDVPTTIIENNNTLSSSISWMQKKGGSLISRSSRNPVSSTAPLIPQAKFPLISTTWEGWAMSANGHLTFYDIPDYNDNSHPNDVRNHRMSGLGIGSELDGITRTRLLIRTVGPVCKYGTKSIAVAFGNIIKVLYFGKEESLPNVSDETDRRSIIYPPSPSPSIASLSGSRKWRREVGY